MSYGNPNQYQQPPQNYNPQVYAPSHPPGHAPHAPPGYNTGAGAQGYTPYNPAQAAPQVAYHGAAPPSYGQGQPPSTGGYGAPAGYSQPPQYGAQPPAGYSQQSQYGSPSSTYAPPASNPYATSHSGAPGYPTQAPPVPAGPPCPPGVDPTLWQVFKVVDSNNSNSISANELQQALANNNWTQFNSETCRLLIGQFDQNKDGSIDIYEFSHLWKYIQDWRQCFEGFDTDKSGTIDVNELQQAFQTFGYRLSIEFCSLCTRVFDRSDKHSMNFDSFIQCCVLMRSLTDSFRRRDTNLNGQINVSYEDFLEMVMDTGIL